MLTAKAVVTAIGSVDSLYSNPKLVRMQNRGTEGYIKIQDYYNKGLIFDPDFQKLYNYYYQLSVAYVTNAFKTEYYTIMYEIKNGASYSFEYIAKRLYSINNRHLFSFITRLMHTTDGITPVYDNVVAKTLGIRPRASQSLKDKIADNKQVIAYMSQLYSDLGNNEDFKAIIADFDKVFPNAGKLPFVKKCDCLISALGCK